MLFNLFMDCKFGLFVVVGVVVVVVLGKIRFGKVKKKMGGVNYYE